MLFKSAIFALGSLAVLSEASVINRPLSFSPLVARQRGGGRNGGNNGNAGNNDANAGNNNANAGTNTGNAAAGGSTCLDADVIQTGSASTGQVNNVAADGQSNSATDTANFINFCSGETLTNGLQVQGGSCNGIVMGKIPATTNMVSTVITNPKLNDNLDAETTFDVTVNVANLQLGTFTNATSTYYSAPQDLAGNGDIIGHTHITIQSVGNSFQFTTPLDATQFVFFKGINDAGNGQGTVTTPVTGGLPVGNYRVCTISSSANHQPVLMPVAQRGAQDDCRYFTVGGNGNANNNNANGNANAGGNNNNANANAGGNNANNGNANANANTGGNNANAGGNNANANAGGNNNNANAGGNNANAGGNNNNANAGANANADANANANNGNANADADANAGTTNNAAADTTSSAAAADTTSSAAAAATSTTARKGKGRGKNNGAAAAADAASSVTSAASSATSAADDTATTSSVAKAAATSSPSTSSSSSAIAGIAAPAVNDSGDAARPFEVNGNTFANQSAAIQRACAIQNNACANAVNSGQAAGFTVGDCNTQETACNAQ